MTGMTRWTGKRTTIAVGILGVAAALGAGISLRVTLVEQWWIWRLESGEFADRFEAARRLGAMGSRRAIPGLVELLSESHGHNREAGELGRILGEIGPAAVPALARALQESRHEREYWRRSALGALLRSGEEAILSLVDLVEDEYLCVSLAAIHALGRMGPEARHAIPALTRCLEDRRGHVRGGAERALREIQAVAGEERSVSILAP